MDKNQIIKAWKDPEYRKQLEADNINLPEHPAGWVNLSDSELASVFGGVEELVGTEQLATFGCCTVWNLCDGINTGFIMTRGCCRDIE